MQHLTYPPMNFRCPKICDGPDLFTSMPKVLEQFMHSKATNKISKHYKQHNNLQQCCVCLNSGSNKINRVWIWSSFFSHKYKFHVRLMICLLVYKRRPLKVCVPYIFSSAILSILWYTDSRCASSIVPWAFIEGQHSLMQDLR